MATIVGTENADTLIGTDADPFTGTGGADTISGLGGNDLIIPGTGGDTIDAGTGDDTIRYTSLVFGRASIDGGAGYDTIDLGRLTTPVTVETGRTPGDDGRITNSNNQAVDGYYTYKNIERFITGSGDDQISIGKHEDPGFGGNAPGVLAGKFWVTAYAGDLEIFAGDGDDSIGGPATGKVIFHGGNGNDTIGLGTGGEMYGDAGDDILGFNIPALGPKTSLIDGGSGSDMLGLYDPVGVVDLAAHTISDTAGTVVATVNAIENVFAYKGATLLAGDDNGNWLLGTVLDGRGGNDILSGQGFQVGLIDQLNGGDGDDVLDGGFATGNDRLIGGSGFDTAIIHFALSEAKVTFGTGYIDISNNNSGQVERITGVESYKFSDGAVISTGDGSVMVDDLYYAVRYASVAGASLDPDGDYNQAGWKLGRDPNAWFSTADYLRENPDVAASGVNPLEHYLTVGWKQGRDPSVNFSTNGYLAIYQDVAAAGLNPLLHYLQYGLAEGRSIQAAARPQLQGDLNAAYYKAANPDVAAAGVDALRHYDQFGWREGRDPNAYFDTSYYLEHNPDVAAAGVNPLHHYEQFGWREGRDPSAAFDTSAYLAIYADVAAAGVDPLFHYMEFGRFEGRSIYAAGFDDMVVV